MIVYDLPPRTYRAEEGPYLIDDPFTAVIDDLRFDQHQRKWVWKRGTPRKVGPQSQNAHRVGDTAIYHRNHQYHSHLLTVLYPVVADCPPIGVVVTRHYHPTVYTLPVAHDLYVYAVRIAPDELTAAALLAPINSLDPPRYVLVVFDL